MKCLEKLAPSLLAALLAIPCSAQVEKLSEQEKQAFLAQLPALSADSPEPLKNHLRKTGGVNAARTALAVRGKSLPGDFIYFNVNPTSDTQYLPDAFPFDGTALGTARIVAAKGEYEPCSFVVYPLRDLGKVQVRTGEFKNASGQVFPARNLDLKFVKVWYQNKNAWYSYFGDTGVKLVPELLVNDEEILRVDTEKKCNFARSIQPDGKIEYEWLGAPYKIDDRPADHFRQEPTYLSMSPKFRDAETLQPVALPEGVFKQFFLTAHVPAGTPEGLYTGSIELAGADGKLLGKIPATIKVLPFELPRAKTYFDPSKDFLVFSYSYTHPLWFATFNGGDFALAEKQFASYMKNKVRHNEDFLHLEGMPGDYFFHRFTELAKQSGMRTDYVLGQIHNPGSSDKPNLRRMAKLDLEHYKKEFGKDTTIFVGYGDENPASWFVNTRPLFEIYQNLGFKFFIAGNHQTFYKAGYFWDFFNMSRPPEDGSQTALWNQIGRAWTGWYAQQHVGVENPAHTRRQYGFAPWLAGYSALANYAHHLGPLNDCQPYNYKPMVFAYGCYNRELDTLSWEGFREGIDDIRYGTLLKSLALQAMKSPDLKTQYAGGQALQLLAEFDRERTDPQSARLEMIRRILQLRTLTGAK